MQDDEREALLTIDHAIDLIEDYCSGLTYDEFIEAVVRLQAVERNIIIIGEALSRLRRRFPVRFDALPAGDRYISLRNIVVHSYDLVDFRIIWKVIVEDLPLLQAAAQSAISQSETT